MPTGTPTSTQAHVASSQGSVSLTDLFDIQELQQIQDSFAVATGVASIITYPDGTPITTPSNFCRLCSEIIRKTDKGRANCYKSDAVLGRYNPDGPVLQPCLSGGLWDAGASITVGGHHVGNWLIGQVRNETQDESSMLAYADDIGADKEEFLAALAEVPSMPVEQFRNVANTLFILVNQLSEKAYQNLRLTQTIAQREQAEQALMASEERFRRIVETANEAIVTLDADCKIIYANSILEQMWGYTPEELLGRHLTDFIYAEDLADHKKQIELRRDGFYAHYERRHKKKDGSEVWCLVSASPIIGPDGTFYGSFGMLTDITMRKKIESALYDSEAKARTLLNVPNILACLVDTYGEYIDCNECFSNLFGKSRDEIIGHMAWEFYDEETTKIRQSNLNTVVTTKSVLHLEELVIDRWYNITLSPIIDNDGDVTLVAIIGVNITEQKQAVEALIVAKAQAEAANRAKSEFLANMSHEIRTPLNGLLGMLHLIRDSGVTGELEMYAEMAMRSGSRLTNLLGDILDLSRIEAGHMPLSLRTFALADVVNSLTDTFSPINFSKRLSFVTSVAPDIPLHLIGDVVRVRQILFNLVGNAMKFAPGGEVELEISSLLPLPPDRVRLLFVVRDCGPGIPDEKIDLICAPFIQVEQNFTRSFQGAGLGLSISTRLIHAMGGTLAFESTAGQGTSVYLTLPFGIPDSAVSYTPLQPQQDVSPPGPLYILLVEDEEISRLSARLILEKMGHQVVTANHGGEALEALRGSTYDCVLMDVQMDVMDGVEATKRIRSGTSGVLDSKVPIVAMTAYAMVGDREKFIEAGMNDYVAKPVQMEELQVALRRVMEKMTQRASQQP